MPVQLDLHIPRHAFSVREVARAGDIWRAFQEAAVLGSSAVGWPPPRYRQEDCAFVVRSMVVRHHAEAQYGEPVRATTWVRNFRRGLLTTLPFGRAAVACGHVPTAREGGEEL